jgi:predicted nucleic acid-binding protein
MLVVADTSPIDYPVLIEQTAVLPALYACVLLPPAVVRELRDAAGKRPM